MSDKINPKTAASTQQYVDIAEIRDGAVILKSGGLRAIIMASSINFVLKSEAEQNAIIYKFQQFLNSLDFPIQIVASSRKLYIGDYLRDIEQILERQENELLRIQTAEYIDFVRSFVEMADIMSKTFYIVVPFTPVEAKHIGFLDKIKSVFKPQSLAKAKQEEFEQYKDQLWQRLDHITIGLRGLEIRAVPLNSQELTELFYTLYNPGIVEKGKLEAIAQLDIAK